MTGYHVKKKDKYYYKCRTIGCKNNKSAPKLNEQFAEVLGRYQVDSTYNEVMKFQMEKVFYTYNEEQINHTKILKKQITEIEGKVETVEEKWVLDKIAEATYTKYLKKYGEEKAAVQKELENCSLDSSNLEKCINYTIEFSDNPLRMWRLGDYLEKQEIQKMVFPDGIVYNRKTDTVRTPRVNIFFKINSLLSKGCAKNKKPDKESKRLLSDLVPRAGVPCFLNL